MNLLGFVRELTASRKPQQEPIRLTAVLLIENSRQDCLLIQKAFEKKYYQVFTTNTDEEGLRIANLIDMDLIIIGNHLPVLNGIEVCKALKENPKTKDIPLVFFTVAERGEFIIQCYEAGADLYLPKSLSPKLLVQEVESLLLEIQRTRKVAAGRA